MFKKQPKLKDRYKLSAKDLETMAPLFRALELAQRDVSTALSLIARREGVNLAVFDDRQMAFVPLPADAQVVPPAPPAGGA